ncbi:MAG: DUF4831 family protein, partial [Mangrovibacterium sp.]
MRKGYLLFAGLLMLSCCLFAQRKDAPAPLMNGIVYSLPRTGVRIYVTVTRDKFFHGPYSQYAEAMLGLKDAASSDRESWTIKDIRIETFSEPDPEQVHKTMGFGASQLSLTSSGVLAGINIRVEDIEESFPVSTFPGDTGMPDIPFPDLSLNAFFEKPDSASGNVLI